LARHTTTFAFLCCSSEALESSVSLEQDWQGSSVSWPPCFLDPMPPVLSLDNDNRLIKSVNQDQQLNCATLPVPYLYDTHKNLGIC
jgi:hypothetical protein